MSSTYLFSPANKWFFLFIWILANVVSLPVLIIGPIGISLAFMFILGRAFDGNIQEDMLIYLITLPVLIIGGIAGGWMGIMQWLVLRQQQIPQSTKWIWASLLGTATATLMFWVISICCMPPFQDIIISLLSLLFVFGLVFCGGIGLSQWLILKQWVYQAGWWILTVIVSPFLGLGLIIGLIAIPFIRQMGMESQEVAFVRQFNFPPNPGLFSLISISLAIVVIGITTGSVLFWLLRFQRR